MRAQWQLAFAVFDIVPMNLLACQSNRDQSLGQQLLLCGALANEQLGKPFCLCVALKDIPDAGSI